MTDSPRASLSEAEFHELATFRHLIRSFLSFSEAAALRAGIESRQHQALLAIKATPPDKHCTVGLLAEQLLLRHQSAVGLVDRMAARDLVARAASPEDRRQVVVRLTSKGERLLQALSVIHREELSQRAPELARALRAIMRRKKADTSS